MSQARAFSPATARVASPPDGPAPAVDAGLSAARPAPSGPAQPNPTPQGPPGGGRRSGQRIYVFGLLLAATVPLLAFAAAELGLLVRQAGHDTEIRLSALARSLLVSVDEQLHFATRLGEALATMPALRQDDLEQFSRTARDLTAAAPDILGFALHDGATGDIQAQGGAGAQAPDAVTDALRQEVMSAAQARGPSIGSVRHVDGRAVVPIRVPVRRDGAADQVATVLLSAAVFDRLFREAGIPDRWIASVIDPSHRVAGRNRASETYAGQTVSAGLRDRLNRGETGLAASTTLDGAAVYSVWSRSRATGWTVLIGAPVAEVEGPARRQAIVMATLGGGALALGIGLALMIGRQMRLGRLAEQAASDRLAALVEERTAEARARETEARAARQRLEDAVQLFPSAIVFYDAQGRLVLCNEKFKEIYAPFRDQIVPGTTIRRMIELAWDHGMIRGHTDRQAYIRARMAMVDQAGLVREVESNGRRMLIQDFRTPDGGVLGIRVDVTTQREIQRALELSEARFRDFAASSSDGLWEVDAELRFTYLSRNFEQVVGLWESAMIGRRWEDIAEATKGDEAWRPVLEALATRQPVRDWIVTVCSELPGDESKISINAIPVFDADGSFVGYRGTIGDVTVRQRAVEALRRSEEQLRLITENVPALISYIDRDERYRFVSRSFCDSYGQASNRIIGRAVEEVMVPVSYARVRDDIRRALAGEIRSMEVVIDYPTGIARDVQVNFIPHVVDGTVRGFFSIAMDISGIKNVERALRRSERQLRTIFDSEPQCITLVDRAGVLIDINPAGLAMLEAGSAEEVKEKSIYPLVDVIHHDAIDAQLGHVFAGETVAAEYTMISLKGNRRQLESVLVPMRGPDGAVVSALGISSDVTQRRAMEQRLRQSQKLEAIGQLTGGVAHDFNNLLSVIMVNLDLLSMDLGDRPDARLICARAMAAAERGASLTQQLLAFARRQHLSPRVIEPNDLIREMRSLLRRMLSEAIDIVAEPLTARWPCRVDRGLIESALLNLALNARDAMPSGGTLTLATADITLDAAAVAGIDGADPGPYVEIAVADSGEGMSAEVKARAFEPFFTTKDFGKGSGLGLSMVYGFARQSGGFVRIDSEPGRGTTVRLCLPAWRAGQEVPPEDKALAEELPFLAAAPAASLPGTRVLVVEDDQVVREAAVSAIAALGYHVSAADSVATALALLEQEPETAIMFTDIGLGEGMNGIELGRLARERFPRLLVLFTSGNPQWRNADGAALLPGAGRILPKPYRSAQIAEALAALLQDDDEG
ncbi:MAG: PAS domain S-box protein [Rhodospirillales bacterium]|nr:PAS domain S-box protein [Rhodospirillales bacterium]